MSFHRYFRDELRHESPKTVEIATDNNLVEGVLIDVEGGTVRVVETTTGYTPTTQVILIPLDAINYVRLINT